MIEIKRKKEQEKPKYDKPKLYVMGKMNRVTKAEGKGGSQLDIDGLTPDALP